MNRGAKDFIVNESGAIAIVVALAMVALLGMAALAFDSWYVLVVQNQLQNAADAGALAGAKAFGENSPNSAAGQTAATNAATAVVKKNYWGNAPLTSCTLTSGYWSFVNSTFTSTTDPNATLPTETPPALWAVQVVVAKSAGNNGGPLSLLFAPIWGINTTNLSGTAVAIAKTSGIWSILETGSSSITLNSNISVNGNVGDNGSSLIFNSGVMVQGKVYLNTNTSLTNNGGVAKGGIQQDSGSNTILTKAVQDAQTAYNQFTGLSNNSGTYPNINSTTTISGTKTVNVVDVTNLLLNSNNTLTLSGTSSMSFVVRVSGTFTLNSNSYVNLSGGLTAGNVTFVATGTSGVIINSNCIMNGSILSPKSSVTLNSNATLNGCIVSGQAISLNSNSVVTPPKTFMPSIGSGKGGALVQ